MTPASNQSDLKFALTADNLRLDANGYRVDAAGYEIDDKGNSIMSYANSKKFSVTTDDGTQGTVTKKESQVFLDVLGGIQSSSSSTTNGGIGFGLRFSLNGGNSSLSRANGSPTSAPSKTPGQSASPFNKCHLVISFSREEHLQLCKRSWLMLSQPSCGP